MASQAKKPGSGVEVRVEGVSKTFETREGDEVQALDAVDLVLNRGEFVAVVGPSGCGKSTLLSMIAGLFPPSSGKIMIGGTEVKRPHPKMAVVFQTDQLLYWRTVVDNVMLPIEIKGQRKKDFEGPVEELLKLVSLDGFGRKYPSELSGGMRQRVAICRALIQNPGLLLMDEPFGALDALTREQLIMDLQEMWLATQNTVMFITHGIEEAIFLADRVLVMSPRPGRIDLALQIDIPRPRRWKEAIENPRFVQYVRQVRDIFEAKGVLVANRT